MQASQENSGRRKTSKYFSTDKPKEEKESVEVTAKRKNQKDDDDSVKPLPAKKIRKVDSDSDDDFIMPNSKNSDDATPRKKLKGGPGRGIVQKPLKVDESDEDDVEDKRTPVKSSGRGRGGRGASAAPAGGRGRGAGRGGFMNFGERKDPPNKGQKVITQLKCFEFIE